MIIRKSLRHRLEIALPEKIKRYLTELPEEKRAKVEEEIKHMGRMRRMELLKPDLNMLLGLAKDIADKLPDEHWEIFQERVVETIESLIELLFGEAEG